LKGNRGRRVIEGVKEETEGEGKEQEEKGKEGNKKTIGIAFWNIAGVKRKDKNFRDYLEKFDVIELCETWIEEREWGSLKLKLSKSFVWKYQYAARVKKKSRARGEIITGIRKGIEAINVEEMKAIDGIQERRLRLEGLLWRIISIYNNSRMKNNRREIEDMLAD